MSNPKYYRTRAKLTQEQLAKQLGKSKTFMCNLETGERKFTLETFCDWADALHLSDAEFVTVARLQQRRKK